jgi:FkbM family methyltransferase
MPLKAIRIAGKRRLMRGISEHDPYFRSLTDDAEMEFVDICRRCIPANAVCLDIGANIGVKALALSEVASSGRVYCFEPAPTVYPVLVSNVAENGCRNVIAEQIAVSDTDGEVLFHENSAWGHLVASGGVPVPASTLATIVGSLGLDRLDFVKIDVEGFEPKVLKGGYEVLKKFNSIVYFEFNTWALIAFTRTDPVAFLEWIFDNFACVAKVNRSSDEALTPLWRQDMLKFLHANMLGEGCVSDLVVCTRMPEVWPVSARAELKTFRTHDDAHATLHKHALSFTTPPGRWQYAVSIDCYWLSLRNAVEIDVRVENGAVGFGLNESTLSHYVSDEFVIRPQDGRKKIRIVPAESMQHAVLVARNVSSNSTSQGTLFAVNIVGAT